MLEILDSRNMPYISFEVKALEDKAASLEAGHYVAKDVDFVNVTPAYSKDIFRQQYKDWIEQEEKNAKEGRLPQEWLTRYKQAYEAWKKGQELPLDGTPIRGWQVLGPAQQETLIRMHILTVEQLSGVNDEGLRRIGIGAVDLKNKAIAWLEGSKTKGRPTMEISKLKKEIEALKVENELLREKLEILTEKEEAA